METEQAALRAALEALILDPDLERLEHRVARFNLFEAMGVVRQELRHSDLLAYLLDPQENHGLGSTFTRRLLRQTLSGRAGLGHPISAIDFDVWVLDGIVVRREWENIDIVLLDKSNRFVVVIENKVGSAEHSDQLRRYFDTVLDTYPEQKVLGIFLSPDGARPSDKRYVAMSYHQVAATLDELIGHETFSLTSDIRTLMRHYSEMLRRNIVSDPKLADWCRDIYRRHRQAIDLIIEHKPNKDADILESMQSLLEVRPDLIIEPPVPKYIQFLPRSWNVDALHGTGWTNTERMLLFQIWIASGSLRLTLDIYPSKEDVYERILLLAENNQPPFRTLAKRNEWHRIYYRTLVLPRSYKNARLSDIIDEAQTAWEVFARNDLPMMTEAVSREVESWKALSPAVGGDEPCRPA